MLYKLACGPLCFVLCTTIQQRMRRPALENTLASPAPWYCVNCSLTFSNGLFPAHGAVQPCGLAQQDQTSQGSNIQAGRAHAGEQILDWPPTLHRCVRLTPPSTPSCVWRPAVVSFSASPSSPSTFASATKSMEDMITFLIQSTCRVGHSLGCPRQLIQFCHHFCKRQQWKLCWRYSTVSGTATLVVWQGIAWNSDFTFLWYYWFSIRRKILLVCIYATINFSFLFCLLFKND